MVFGLLDGFLLNEVAFGRVVSQMTSTFSGSEQGYIGEPYTAVTILATLEKLLVYYNLEDAKIDRESGVGVDELDLPSWW